MNKKFIVPFEMAKLLKEKGYPQLGTEHYYNINGDMVVFSDDYEGYTEDIIMRIEQDFYAAPTYHEVVDWLEGRKVRIYAEYCNGWWYGFIDNSETMEIEATVRYQTREEALNAGILAALEML